MNQVSQAFTSGRAGTGQTNITMTGMPAWAVGAAMFTLSLNPLGTGVSTLSNELARAQQISPFARKDGFFDRVADYASDDWDGDGAVAVSADEVANARSLLNALNVSNPEIVAGSDGSICMEWIRQSSTGEKKVYVDVGPKGKVLTFARFGQSSPIEKHFNEYGPDVIDHLRVLFSIYAA
ncbi:MAG: hypothetical protein ABSG88_21895 [Bradyrhizobium sp.]